MKYFDEGTNKDDCSPLQTLFQIRPEKEDETKTFTVEQHTGFIRVIYWMLVKRQCNSILDLNKDLEIMRSHEFDPKLKVHYDLKGSISHNKKNRTNVKVDYCQAHIVSQNF